MAGIKEEHPTGHIVSHLRDRDFQAVSCTSTDNQLQKPQRHIKITVRWKKLAIIKENMPKKTPRNLNVKVVQVHMELRFVKQKMNHWNLMRS